MKRRMNPKTHSDLIKVLSKSDNIISWRILHEYCHQQLIFIFQELWNKMSVKDQENFFFNMEKLDWTSYIYSSLRGSRLYIAKDDPSTIPYSLKRQKTLKFIHYIFTYTVKGLAIYMLYLILHQIYFSLILPVF